MLPVVHNVVHREGVSSNAPGRTHECVHKTHIVACHVRANGTYICGNEEVLARSPYLGLLPAGERDCNGLVGPYEMYWCAFEWDGVQRETGSKSVLLELHNSRVRRGHLHRLNGSELRNVIHIFRDLQRLSRHPDLSSQIRASTRVLELLALWGEPDAHEGEERAVRAYRSLIEQCAEEHGTSLRDIAEKVGYSPDHLGVLFQKEMGMTPSDYRMRLRLLRARELLVTTVLPVSEIAREVGFPDANYFARIFRRTYGMSPRQFSRTNVPGLAG